jgi:hypothetical protein
MENTITVLNVVHDALKIASDYNLEAEVMAYAMIFLKDNPKITISEAIQCGLNEWIK